MVNPQKNLSETEGLRALLEEDLDSAADAQTMLPLITRLKQMPVPEPTAQQTALLIDSLMSEMPAPKPRDKRWLEYWPLLLMRSQLRVVRREIWAASALVMLLGTLVALTTQSSAPSNLAPFSIVAPLVAAVGVGLLYDSESEQMLELENSTLASTRMLLLARLTLVFGFDLLLSLGGSIVLALFHADVLLWPLVISWLAPMAFLSALSFGISVLSRDALFGSLSGLMLWGVHIAVRAWPDANPFVMLLSFPGLTAPENRLLLLVLAPVMVGLTLWFAGRDESRIGELK